MPNTLGGSTLDFQRLNDAHASKCGALRRFAAPVHQFNGTNPPRFVAPLIALLLLVLGGRAQAQNAREDFLKLIDRPRVPLAPSIQPTTRPAPAGMDIAHFTYAADAQNRVPGLILKPAGISGRSPVVIVLHGTGGTKESEMKYMTELANKGFIAVAIDGRYHGERAASGKGSAEYQDAIVKAWRDTSPTKEHPFFYDTAWDVMRLIDYLSTRDDIDPSRIGLTGISKGGVETYFTAAIDPRVSVSVPFIGVQSFNWALENNDWQGRIGTISTAFATITKESGIDKADSNFVRKFYDRAVPGIYGEFDGPAMLGLICPRPLMMVNSDSDNHTPLAGVKLCIDAAEKDYKAANASDHFVAKIQAKTGHKVNPDSQTEAVEFFAKWLKPQVATAQN